MLLFRNVLEKGFRTYALRIMQSEFYFRGRRTKLTQHLVLQSHLEACRVYVVLYIISLNNGMESYFHQASCSDQCITPLCPTLM